MSEYFPDHHRVFNTGDDLNGTAAFAAITILLKRPLAGWSPWSWINIDSVNSCSWPGAAISDAEIGYSRTTAYWPEPSISQTDWLMAAVDPDCVKTPHQI